VLVLNQKGWSQNNPLDNKITISVTNQPVEKVLNMISTNGNINFSYNSDIIPLDSVVSLNFDQKEIYKILNYLLLNNYVYKTTGQHIIIQKKKNVETAKTKINLKGSVREASTDIKIANASVYYVSGKEGVLTDVNGDFSITLQPKNEYVSLCISNQSYEDTIVFVNPAKAELLSISLKPKLSAFEPIEPKTPLMPSDVNVEQSKMVAKIVKPDMITHANNINFYKQRPLQVSFLPYAGTNYKLSGSIVNKFSLNVLSGYSYGVDGVEIGGFLNINRNRVSGLQIGGFGNVTGKNTKGVQIAGFFNHNFGGVEGVQIGGFSNLVLDTIKGVQIAGFSNILRGKIRGAQISGFSNITTNEVIATQVSGFLNLALKSSKGVQASGFANYTNGNQNGVQLSGFANGVKGNMKGAQVAGFLNAATNDFSGVQISGFINYAKKVKGVQIGVINIADTVSGVSIGLFNFIRKGFHQIAAYTDETGSANLQLSMGTFKFYSILGLSAQPFYSPKSWGAVYGFGTRFLSQKWFDANLNLTVANLNFNKFWETEQSQQYKLSTDINLRISEHFSIFTAPSYNVFRYTKERTELDDYPVNYLNTAQSRQMGNNTLRQWFGVSLGLKYRF